MLKGESKYTDQEIISGLKLSDNKVWDQVYKEYQPWAKSMLFDTVNKSNDFEDLYINACVTFYENIKKPEFELKSKLRTYFLGIFKFKCLEYLRNKGKSLLTATDFADELFEVTDYTETKEDHWLKKHRENVLKDCIKQLTERQNNVIIGFYYGDLSMAQIAQKENITNEYAKVENNRAKNVLKKCLEKHKL